MRVLVAYASRHGTTAEIAEQIAATLAEHGLSAKARPVDEVEVLRGYDAVIIGGATYLGHWLKPAVRFARRHPALASLPVWLFSSGPVTPDTVDEDGNDILESARPEEFEELTELLHPRGVQVFFGAFDPDQPPVGLGETLTRVLPGAKDALPSGDYRDWDAIRGWARQVAQDLTAETDVSTSAT